LNNGYTFIDSAERSKTHSETWAHPPQEALDKIAPGYLVKVGVTHPELSGERFWGRVTQKTGANIVIEVDQDMRYSTQHGVSDKDALAVREQNVFGITDTAGATVWQA
jgi:hypothetical protein